MCGEGSSKAFGLEMKEHPSCIGTRGCKNTMGILPFQRLNDLDSENLNTCWVRALRVYATHPTCREDPLAHRCCSGSISSQILRATWQDLFRKSPHVEVCFVCTYRLVISVVPNRAANQASLPKPNVGMCDKLWTLRLQNQKTTTMCPAFSIFGCHVLIKMFLNTTLEVWKSSRPNKVVLPRGKVWSKTDFLWLHSASTNARWWFQYMFIFTPHFAEHFPSWQAYLAYFAYWVETTT